ncbi:immune inhibitor A domain-containing protein [Yinghuangia seranimata]|uniref:immune inhibitor A domain-containing protein n=1 Tax=Yinghuangia seranimata TaxID=408067 RepID=UPI00248C8ED2|nr:immune inhibitor A domain-containing protein [Yinghuangia seranimata]MDI2131386.1 immune inhibitor A [Yinghuangia seranimata]
MAVAAVAGLACCLLAVPGLESDDDVRATSGQDGGDLPGVVQGSRGYWDARAREAAPVPQPGPRTPAAAAGPGTPGDDLPGPFTDRRKARRAAAVNSVMQSSQSRGAGPHTAPDVVTLPGGPKVELRPPTRAKVFVILVEFGDRVDGNTTNASDGSDGSSAGRGGQATYGGVPGPRHDTIPAPDRSVDHNTVWTRHFDRDYFRNVFFGDGSKGPSLVTHYRAQSSGRMEVEGNLTDWVRVQWNEARYGSNYCGAVVCTNAWDLVRDAMNQWYADRVAEGLTDKQIADALAPYDVWDRDDHNHNGKFDEPDGYIDHLEIVKAGVDEAAGGGAQGTNALWSHRWYAYGDQAGRAGPPGNLAGGTRVGNSNMWAGDYTLQAENGGLGVIAHEFGHDLGLPDLYDRKDTSSGSPVAFWSLMGLSGYLSDGKSGLGTAPGSLSAWDRLQLGWLDWMIADPTATTSIMLAPLQSTGDPQAIVIPLPGRKDSAKARWYVVENRQYLGTDASLRTGPYDGQASTPESGYFPYGSGVLVWLWDTSYEDNDVADHPGEGLILPVDAHSEPLLVDDAAARARLALFDAPFTAATDRTDPILLNQAGGQAPLPARPGNPVFDDRTPYWSPRAPLAGVKVAEAGIHMTVDTPARTGDAVRLTIGPSH